MRFYNTFSGIKPVKLFRCKFKIMNLFQVFNSCFKFLAPELFSFFNKRIEFRIINIYPVAENMTFYIFAFWCEFNPAYKFKIF